MLTLAVMACAVAALLAATVRYGADTYGGPLAMVAAFMGTVTVARPLMFAVGLDDPYLQNPAFTGDLTALAQRSLLLVVGWVAVLAVVAIALRPAGHPPEVRALPRPVTDAAATTVAVALLVVGAVGTVWYIARLGSVARLATVNKANRTPVNPLVRSTLVWAAALAAAQAAVAATNSQRRTASAVAVAAAAIGLLWGPRDVIVLPVVAAVAAWAASGAPTSGWRPTRRQLRTVALAALVVVGVATVARLARDEIFTDRPTPVQEGPLVSRVAIAANLTGFDALMVVRSHWPDDADYLWGRDFVRQLPAPLGRPPMADEPANFNVRVAQISVPGRRNGTPPTAVGDWYAAAGWRGIVAGAALSGALLALLERLHRRLRQNQAALAASGAAVVIVGALPSGLSASTLGRLGAIVLPGVAAGIAQLVLSRRGQPATAPGWWRATTNSAIPPTLRSASDGDNR